MAKKFIVGLLFVSLFPSFALAQSTEQQIASLLAQIQALTALLNQLQGGQVQTTLPQQQRGGILSAQPGLTLYRNLGPGDSGEDVSRLQAHLALDPSIYPEGIVSGNYRSLTTAAIQRFQIACDIVTYGNPDSTGFGRVGPVTRRALQYGCRIAPTPIPTSVPTPTPTSAISPTSGPAPLNVTFQTSFPTIACDVAAGVNQIYRLQHGDGSFQELYSHSQGKFAAECGRTISRTAYHLYTKVGVHTVTLEELGPSGEGNFTVLATRTLGTVNVGSTDTTLPTGTNYGIQVRLQSGTDSVARGSPLLISWDPTVTTPPSNAAVRLELRRASDSTLVGEGGIVNDLAINGSYVWYVPAFSNTCSTGNGQLCSNQIIDGQQYRVRAILYQPRGSCFGTNCTSGPTILATSRTDAFYIGGTGGALHATPSSGAAPLVVSISADVNSSGSCSASTYSIDFGDGSAKENLNVQSGTCRMQTFVLTHTYNGNATYTIKLFGVPASDVTSSTDTLHTTTVAVSDGSGAGGIGTLLVHADGGDGSRSFPDSASSPSTITAIGNAQVDTAQSKFGGASAFFDGSGDYLSIADSANWYFGSGDFTVDFWIRLNALTTTNGIFGQGSGSNAYRMYIASDGSVVFQVWNGGVNTHVLSAGAGTFATGSWYHVALVRNGNNFALYKNGSSVASATDSDSIPDLSAPFTIGAADGSSVTLNGWIDEFRVVKGSAAWTSGFSVPTAPYGSNPIVSGNSIAYTSPGTYSFAIPSHSSLSVTLWGGGGGGAGSLTTGGSGTASTFSSLSAGGGAGGGIGIDGLGGTGGTAIGGTTNINGNSGLEGRVGTGGTAPNGGAGGTGVPLGQTGTAGAAPGGGGGGASGGGGGSGAYVQKTYSSGTFSTNSTVSVVVGSGGMGGTGYCRLSPEFTCQDGSDGSNGSATGGAGASGKVMISWQ